MLKRIKGIEMGGCVKNEREAYRTGMEEVDEEEQIFILKLIETVLSHEQELTEKNMEIDLWIQADTEVTKYVAEDAAIVRESNFGILRGGRYGKQQMHFPESFYT